MGTTHAIMSCLTKTDWSGYWVMLKGENMATHYKGERISVLLERIESLKAILDENAHLEPNPQIMAVAYTDLAIAKAKYSALRGEHHGKD